MNNSPIDPVDDEKDDDQTSGDSAPLLTEAPSGSATTFHPVVQDYMERLRNAQAQASKNQEIAGYTSAANQLVNAISRSPDKVNNSGAEMLAKNANAPIKNLMDEQGAIQMQKDSDKADPDSDASTSFRKSLKLVAPQIADAYGESFAKITAADAPDIMKTVQMKAQLDQRAEAAQLRAETAADKSQDRADALSSKQSADQDKAYTEATKAMQSFRGNKSVQNASEALRNSDSAMALINSKADLNSFTNEQYNTIVAEMAKIATGGAATEGSIHDAKASSLQSKAAAFMQSVSGKPTPAQMGEFIAQNKEYLQHLNDVNHKYVDDYRRQIAKGFKHRLSADDYKELQEDSFPDRTAGAGNMGAPAQTPPSVGANAGTVLIKDPKGNIRSVPVGMKAAALANGGQLVQ